MLYLCAFLLDCVKLTNAMRIAGMAGLLFNCALLINLDMLAGHLPVFNLFESLMSSSFVLAGLCLLFAGQHKDNKTNVSSMVWAEILLFFLITFLFPKVPAVSRYDFNIFFVVCFFLFRVFSFSMALFSTALFFASRRYYTLERENTENLKKGNRKNFCSYSASNCGTLTFHKARNFLLLGALMFLISEYSGMIWCQNGWGDMWQWSGGHLQSVFIFFYLMLSFHIQEKKINNHKIQSFVAGMTGFIMLAFMVIRGLD